MRVLSSLAIKEAYLELVPAFQAKTGHKVDTEWLGMVDILKRIKAGESPDMVIAPQKAPSQLKTLGRVAAGGAPPQTRLPGAGKKGAGRPDHGPGRGGARRARRPAN